MGAIKGVGNAAISKILEARAEAPFADISDFISRIDSSKVNKKVLESFIKSGSFDDFGYTRRALLENIDSIIEASAECSRAKKMAEYSLFGDMVEMTTVQVSIDNIPEFDNKRMLELEKETIGFYISGHPLDAFRAEIGDMHYTLSSEKDQIEDGSKALFIGKVEAVHFYYPYLNKVSHPAHLLIKYPETRLHPAPRNFFAFFIDFSSFLRV
jgi:DNA polymerase-3 subunit alpha